MLAGFRALLFSVSARRRHAGAGRSIATPTDFLLAVGGAAVAVRRVLVVTAFRETHDSVSAFGEGLTGFVGLGAGEPGFDGEAVTEAPVTVHFVAVVAGFVVIQDPVSAVFCGWIGNPVSIDVDSTIAVSITVSAIGDANVAVAVPVSITITGVRAVGFTTSGGASLRDHEAEGDEGGD